MRETLDLTSDVPVVGGGPAATWAADEPGLVGGGLLGSYREQIGWGRGRRAGSLSAIGPRLDAQGRPLIS